MYMLNTYRWDFPLLAALVAPRPLLISNTDNDRIFPLDGVVDVYTKTRRIYELCGKPQNIGLQISEGPHKDTQQLRIAAFHWFNKFLKQDDPLIETVATKHHCRVITGVLRADLPPLRGALPDWAESLSIELPAAEYSPSTIDVRSWPGLFAHKRLDPASAQLLSALPACRERCQSGRFPISRSAGRMASTEPRRS